MTIAFLECKLAFPKTVHFGRFVENAHRPQEIPFSLRIQRADTVRGPASVSAILQIAQSSLLPSASSPLAALQPPVSFPPLVGQFLTSNKL
jgi:hypothetical protein